MRSMNCVRPYIAAFFRSIHGHLCITVLILAVALPAHAEAEFDDETIRALETPYTIEFYYKLKPLAAPEFLELYKKNHWPVLMKEKEKGDLLSVSIDQSQYTAIGDSKWDLRIRITFKNILLAHGLVSRHQEDIESSLFSDHEAFKDAEKRRFDLVEDLGVVLISPVLTENWSMEGC